MVIVINNDYKFIIIINILYLYFFIYYLDQQTNSRQLVNCITTLYIFSKIRASFLLHHAKTLHPYLSSKCTVNIVLFDCNYVQ